MDFAHFIQVYQLQNFFYLVMFAAMFTDAALTVFAAVFLVSVGALSLLPTVFVLLAGIFCEQLGFYWLGTRLSTHDRLSRWADKLAAPFDRHLQARPFHTLLISKFIYGMHRAMLIRSGMLRLPLGKFTKYALANGVIWLAAVGGLGFLFSESYQEFKRYFAYAELIFLVLVVVYFVTQRLLARRLEKEL